MDLNQTKIIAGKIVTILSIPKDKKHELLDYIQTESNKYKIMDLFIENNTNRFLMELNFGNMAKKVGGKAKGLFSGDIKSMLIVQGVMMFATPVIKGIATAIHRAYDKCEGQCSTFEDGSKYKMKCAAECKLKKAESELQLINKNRSNCKSSRDPQKCLNKTNQAIQKTQILVKNLRIKVNALKRGKFA